MLKFKDKLKSKARPIVQELRPLRTGGVTVDIPAQAAAMLRMRPNSRVWLRPFDGGLTISIKPRGPYPLSCGAATCRRTSSRIRLRPRSRSRYRSTIRQPVRRRPRSHFVWPKTTPLQPDAFTS